jgi:Flp pilus assembly protein TadD
MNISSRTKSKPGDMRLRVILFLILSITFMVYFPSLKNGFVNWDDDLYVRDNSVIRSLSFGNARKMASSFFVGNYQPLTILSYALDHRFFGMDPFGYHLTNLVFHLLNTLFVFWLIRILSPRTAVAGAVALMFGIHPLHVESVAWISERKDVLYAFFFLAALLCYGGYLKTNFKKRFYYAALVLFFFSLLSKAMAMTLPLILFLMDRFFCRRDVKNAWLEKIPFFTLSILFGVVAFLAQVSTGAVRQQEFSHGLDKVLAAPFAVAFYTAKLIFPVKLSCLYPYFVIQGDSLFFLVRVALIVGAVGVFLFLHRRSKVLVFSVLFFLLTIAPVLQAVPVGQALVADRYVYIPCIGLFFGLSEGVYWLLTRKVGFQNKAVVGLVLLLPAVLMVGLGVSTWKRCHVWKNSATLWRDVLAQFPRSATASNNLGAALAQDGRKEEAAVFFERAIEVEPSDSRAVNNLGMAYRDVGRGAEAVALFEKATQINPRFGTAYHNLCGAYAAAGRKEEASVACARAIAIEPENVRALVDLGVLYGKTGRGEEAWKLFHRALVINPNDPAVLNDLGVMSHLLGRREEAIAFFNKALKIKPDYAEARANLALSYSSDPGR